MIAELAFVALQVMALPTSKLAWDAATDNPDYFKVRYNTGSFVSVGLPPLNSEGAHAVTLLTLPAGEHIAEVVSCWADDNCSAAVPVTFVMQAPAPVCADVPSVFITRWEHTTGKPGSRMRVNFQPASISPITEIEAKVNGAVVARIAGSDLRDTAGVWFTTPASGSYKLQVWAKNSAGCTREVFSPVDLIVK
jgi:hypothetical protein